MRSLMMPAMGATRIGIAVQGSVRSPASSGEYPWTIWKNWASRKIAPNMPKLISSEVALAAEKARLRKKRMGTIGSVVRSSHQTKAPRRTMPAAMGPATPRLVQPCSLPRTRPQTMPSRPTLARPRPGRSRARLAPLDSVSRRQAIGSRTTPMGTLSQKIHCQDRPSTTAPPTTGPRATARPQTPPQMPSARPRRAGDTAPDRIVRVSGVTIAPPTPCRARAAMSASMLGASAAAAEPRVKIASPTRNMRLRPNRSPSAAPVSSKTAKVSVYAFTVHSSPCSEAPRSFLITGSAVVTTRLSSETMNTATDVTMKVQMLSALVLMLLISPV